MFAVPFVTAIVLVGLLIWLNFKMIDSVEKHTERPAFGIIHILTSVMMSVSVVVFVNFEILDSLYANQVAVTRDMEAKYQQKIAPPVVTFKYTVRWEKEQVLHYCPAPLPTYRTYENVRTITIGYRSGDTSTEDVPPSSEPKLLKVRY